MYKHAAAVTFHSV